MGIGLYGCCLGGVCMSSEMGDDRSEVVLSVLSPPLKVVFLSCLLKVEGC